MTLSTLYRSRNGVHTAEYTAQERASIVVYELCVNDRQMTTAEIAERVGTTSQGAWQMMQRISRVVPVDQRRGRWTRS